jgi:hypothetical protein
MNGLDGMVCVHNGLHLIPEYVLKVCSIMKQELTYDMGQQPTIVPSLVERI